MINELAQMLLDADAVARKRGDKWGLCDAIDNAGNPYPSQRLADLLEAAREKLGLSENPRIKEKSFNEKWSTAKQWER